MQHGQSANRQFVEGAVYIVIEPIAMTWSTGSSWATLCGSRMVRINSSESPSPQPCSTGIAVTEPPTEWIERPLKEMTVWHFDVELKKRLEVGEGDQGSP